MSTAGGEITSEAVRTLRLVSSLAVTDAKPSASDNLFTDAAGELSVGFWVHQPGVLNVNYTEDEVCVILEGEVRLVAADGSAETYKAGDMFFIPAGFKGAWETLVAVRKLYVIREKLVVAP